MKNLLCIIYFIPAIIFGQTKPLQVIGTAPDLYLVHTTGPKESFYSIGRIYNISPKIMAPHNDLVLEKGLNIGQVIKIQLNDVNFSQDGVVAEDEVLVPLYHKTKPKETLYNISVTHNKIPVGLLKQWNNLKTDAVPGGSNMIVGYLKVKKDLSPLAANAVSVKPIASANETETVKEPVVQTVVPAIKADEPKANNKVEAVVAQKEEPVKKSVPIPKKDDPLVKKAVSPASPGKKENGAGAFKGAFESQPSNQDISQSGMAGIFKSNSGWTDGKYYCLHNSARAGSIIKITNPANQLSVYAKVLDVIPDIDQNEGMIVRLSNAAAEALGVSADNFPCSISF